jgi:LytR cell envelope-related transcriptional attenuator
LDHYAPSHDLAHPWRTRTLIATGIAALELLALVGLGVVLLGKGWFQHARATAAQSSPHRAAATTTKPKSSAQAKKTTNRFVVLDRPLVPRGHLGLLVLNGNGQDGAAGAEAKVLRAHGYPVENVGNAKRDDYAASIVMYRPGYAREAARLAHDVGITVVTALDGLLPSQLRAAKIAIIVGK